MVERKYTFTETVVYGFGSGVGFLLAIAAMAAIRYRLRYSNVPKELRGGGITMLLTGLLSKLGPFEPPLKSICPSGFPVVFTIEAIPFSFTPKK